MRCRRAPALVKCRAMQTIGLIAAMPDEIRPLLRMVGEARREQCREFPLWRVQTGDTEACLVESGMGPLRAATAAEALISAASPSIMLSFGFGGAILPGLRVGDMVLGTESWLANEGRFSRRQGIAATLAGEIAAELGKSLNGIASGTIITSAGILKKADLIQSLPAGTSFPILDMETAAIAEIADRHGIPLVALRAVSDDAGEELSFSIDEFTGPDMAISPLKVMATIVRKPWIIPQLLRLARNSRIAGKRLAQGVLTTLDFLAGRQ